MTSFSMIFKVIIVTVAIGYSPVWARGGGHGGGGSSGGFHGGGFGGGHGGGESFHGGWGGGHHSGVFHGGWGHRPHYYGGIGFGFWPGYYGGYYPSGWYGGYYGYPNTVVTVPVSPPVYIQKPDPGYHNYPAGYWYYCETPAGYYPYIKQCLHAWQRVEPRPNAPR